jgi:hypothetical protein
MGEGSPVRGTVEAMSLSYPITAGRFDAAVQAALADPGFTERCAADPDFAAGHVTAACELATAAFTDHDPEALGAAHRALYHLAAQGTWSPIDAPRFNEHDLTLAAVRLELERGLEAQLAAYALPGDLPEDPEAFGPWLEDLALHRDIGLPPSGMAGFYRERATLEQMKEIVAQRSLFFLKEPDPWAMVIPSLRGEAKAGLLDVLLDEYGWGRHDHMHSTVYENLMGALGLETGFDAYFERTAWQFLAVLNYQWMLARHRRLCRRMYGYIYLVEADSPDSMRDYLAAWDRLGIQDEAVRKFYDLHVTADEGHQQVALQEMIMPVVRAEPGAARDIARGVLEGRVLHHAFSTHLAASFAAGRSSFAA